VQHLPINHQLQNGLITNYKMYSLLLIVLLQNGLIKVRRRWGQRHPQGANSGSNGKLKLMLNSKQLPPAHHYPMLANVYPRM
jgi:hypothetical protein